MSASIGSRLRSERLRLKMTQKAMASACGVSNRQQLNYEGQEQIPGGAYLAHAAGLGVDIVYVLKGKAAPGSNAEESRLLAAYRNAKPEMKRLVLAALTA